MRSGSNLENISESLSLSERLHTSNRRGELLRPIALSGNNQSQVSADAQPAELAVDLNDAFISSKLVVIPIKECLCFCCIVGTHPERLCSLVEQNTDSIRRKLL